MKEGVGNEWEELWFGARSKNYEPMFEELLNKYLAKSGVYAGKHDSIAKYKLVLKTIKTDPIYPERHYSHFPFFYNTNRYPNVDFEIAWIEIATDSLMAKHEIKYTQFFAGDYYLENSIPAKTIANNYALAGKHIGKLMSKAIENKRY